MSQSKFRRVAHGTGLAAMFAVGMGGALSAPACSTDDICDEACEIWDNCQQVEGNTVNYPYDRCYDECQSEGDWTRGYVRCLRKQDTCPQLGNICG